MSSTNLNNKLQAKDLINVGIFTAIYFVVYFVVMMIAYIPILTLTLGFLCPIFCGIPTMLYFTKVKKFGMITLMGTILGLIMMVMGSGFFVLGAIYRRRYPYDEFENFGKVVGRAKIQALTDLLYSLFAESQQLLCTFNAGKFQITGNGDSGFLFKFMG